MAVIKVGNNSIGKISVIEPYDDAIGVSNSATYAPHVEDWVRPSEWLDMPSISSGVAVLLFVPSGYDNFGVSLSAASPGASNNCPTHIPIDWGDGSSDLIHGTRRDNIGYAGAFGLFHKRYDFDLLPESTQFSIQGRPVRQVVIELDGSTSGISYVDLRSMNGKDFGSISTQGVSNYFTDADGSVVSTTQRSFTTNSGKRKATTILDVRIDNPTEAFQSVFANNNYTEHEYIENVEYNVSGLYPYQTFYQMGNLRNAVIGSGTTLTSTDARDMFHGCTRLVKAPELNTSNITNMGSMFNGCESLKYIPDYDTSNVTSFNAVFAHCKSLENYPNFDTSAGTDFSSMFYQNIQLTSAPSGYNFDNGTNFASMFYNCHRLGAAPPIDLSNATGISSMFGYCSSLKYVPKINAPNLSSNGFSQTFWGCSLLDRIEIGDVGAATSFLRLFRDCTSLKKLTWDNSELVQPTNMQECFLSCRSLNDYPQFDTSQVTTFQSAYGSNFSLVYHPVIDMTSCTNMNNMFDYCHNLKEVNFKNVLNKPLAGSSFRYCYGLEKGPSGLFQDYNSTPLRSDYMFFNDTELKDISHYVVSGTTNQFQPFHGCTLIQEGPQDIKTTNMSYLFGNCWGLKTLKSYDLSMVTNFGSAFANCYELAVVDATGMAVSVAFNNCYLSSGEITKIFYNLASGVSGQTINVSSNYGTPELHADAIAIAEDKGWTVTT